MRGDDSIEMCCVDERRRYFLVSGLVRRDGCLGFCSLLSLMGEKFHAVTPRLSGEGGELGASQNSICFQVELPQDQATFTFKIVITKSFCISGQQAEYLTRGGNSAGVGARNLNTGGLYFSWESQSRIRARV